MDTTRTRNNSNNDFGLGIEKMFETTESQGCDVVGLGFMAMPMPMHSHTHNHQQQQLPTSCYHDEGFDHGGEGGGGPIVCNTSNQEPCRGDIYDVVGVLKSLHNHHHSFSADSSFPHNSPGEMAAAPVNTRVPFTAAQWQELERQTMIYKYMMSSVPVPSELLIPITRNHSNAMKGSLELGFSSSNSSDPEPWRCRRTDGKKWRCSRNVAPDQKYCERHSHKSRPRSRKHVELSNHSSNTNNNDHNLQTLNNNSNDHKLQTLNNNNNNNIMASDGTKQPTHQNPHFMNHNDANLFTFDQSRCLEWFVKGEATTTVPFTSNSNTEWQQFKEQGSTNYGLNEQFNNPSLGTLGRPLNLNHQTVHSQETRAFIDAWSTADREVVGIGTGLGHVSSNEKLLTLSMSGGNENSRENGHETGGFGIMGGLGTEKVRGLRPPTQMGDGPSSRMGSSPGGPLAEALCLGIASSQTTSTSSCSKST